MNTTNSPSSSPFGMLPRILAVGLIFLSMLPGMAATLTWDPTQAITSPPGGFGNWNTSSAFWSNGTSDVVWNNANNDTASFGGTSATYTVTVPTAVAITAGGLTVTSGNNVTLLGSGTGSLTLAGAKTITTGGTLNLEIALDGSAGLTKLGGGIVFLKTPAIYAGDTTFSQGQITLGINDGLPTTTKLAMVALTTFSMQARNQTLAGLSGTGGQIRSTSTGTSILTITGGTGTYAGTIIDNGGLVHLSLVNAGSSNLTLTGTNTYSGGTTVTGGTLSLGSNLANTASVTVSGGALASTVANVNLGLGATSMSSGAVTPGGIGTVGSFTLASGQNFSTTGGTLNIDLSSAISFDQIIGGGVGAFSLANTTLALSGLTSTSGTYQLFTGFGGSNSVTGLTITGLSPGYTGSLDTAGLLTVVPEPSTWALLAFSLTTVIVMRRRAKRF